MTRSEENYLKTIYHLGNNQNDTVTTNAIADQMKTKPSSVTDMLKKLSEKNLVHYIKYKGVKLTAIGSKTALSIIRKHRLWEVFLVEKLDFSWDEVHEVAEQLEHIKSEKLVDKLDQHLGFPRVDPHGDPIPSKNGEFIEAIKKLLSALDVGSKGVCIGVKDSSTSFLKFLDKNGIALGHRIILLEKEEFDSSLLIKVENREMYISQQIAANLYIQLENEA